MVTSRFGSSPYRLHDIFFQLEAFNSFIFKRDNAEEMEIMDKLLKEELIRITSITDSYVWVEVNDR